MPFGEADQSLYALEEMCFENKNVAFHSYNRIHPDKGVHRGGADGGSPPPLRAIVREGGQSYNI